MNEYVVAMRAASAACFAPDDVWQIEGDPSGTRVRLRTLYRDGVPLWLEAWSLGKAESIDHAAEIYANSVGSLWHVIAVGANAAVAEPHVVSAYEPVADHAKYMIERFAVAPSEPPLASRTLDIEATARLFECVAEHRDHERLRRAMEHYAGALRETEPATTIHAANNLFLAVETLTEVVIRRLREAGAHDDLETLAKAEGFEPRDAGDKSYLNAYRGEVRRREIFDGDASTFRDLKTASDGYEHGFLDFHKVRQHADRALDAAFAHVRRSILRETGLPDEYIARLTSGSFERPLAMWPVRVFVAGVLHATGEQVSAEAMPIVFDVVPSYARERFDPEQQSTAGSMSIHVKGDPDGPKFDALKYTVRSPGRIIVEGPGDVDAGFTDGSGE